MSTAPILVLAVGNPSRGDDAFGPELAARLDAWLATQDQATRAAIDLITDQQLVVEHLLDLQGRQRVLFVDAAARGEPPLALTPVTATTATPVNSHSSTPAQLLALYQALLQAPPPPADLLTLTGQDFRLGEPLSAHAQALLPSAWVALRTWLHATLQDLPLPEVAPHA